jgi:hypothetical protein
MQNIFTLALCIVLLLIVYYDFKYLSLPVYCLVIAVILGIIISLLNNGLVFTFYFAGINCLLLCSQIGLSIIYFSIREGKMVNILNSKLGAGDLIFFVILVFCFSPINFIIFSVVSGFLILLYYSLFSRVSIIPYAGWLSAFLLTQLLLSLFFYWVQPYNDFFLLERFWN